MKHLTIPAFMRGNKPATPPALPRLPCPTCPAPPMGHAAITMRQHAEYTSKIQNIHYHRA